jgi:hypothetical protein
MDGAGLTIGESSTQFALRGKAPGGSTALAKVKHGG